MTVAMQNRQELQDAYINKVIDSMDLDDCLAMLFDYLDKDFDSYTDDELNEEVKESFPELLEG